MKGRISLIIRTICFFLILVFVLGCVFAVFSMPPDLQRDRYRLQTFYQQPKNSLDAVVIGASGVYRGYSSIDAWSNYGLSTYAYSAAQLPAQGVKYVVKDILKTQDPDVIVIDYRTFAKNLFKDISQAEFSTRHTADNMPISKNQYDFVKSMMDTYDLPTDDNGSEYFFSFLKYHQRWQNSPSEGGITIDEIKTQMEKLKGDYIDKTQGTLYTERGFKRKKTEDYRSSPPKETDPIFPEMEKSLLELCDYLKGIDQEVLFVAIPANYPIKAAKRLNHVEQILDNEGFDYLNMMYINDKTGIDPAMDFYNPTHANHYGREKITKYLSKYMVDKYDLPDHRGDPNYAYWDDANKEAQKIIADIEKAIENKDKNKSKTK